MIGPETSPGGTQGSIVSPAVVIRMWPRQGASGVGKGDGLFEPASAGDPTLNSLVSDSVGRRLGLA